MLEESQGNLQGLTEQADLAQERLRLLAEATPAAVIIRDPRGRWQEVNTTSRGLLRLDNLPWREKDDQELAALDSNLAPFCKAMAVTSERAYASRAAQESRATVVDPQGQCRTLDLRLVSLFDARGERAGTLLVGQDVSERLRLGAGLTQAGERLHAALAAVREGVIATDAQGRVELLNGPAEQLTDWRAAEATGHALTEVLHIVHPPSSKL
jgi:PAS domain-containing protein